MEGGESRKDLDPGGYRDDYRGGGKVGPRVHIHPHGEHMVSSDHEPEESDGPHGVDYAQRTEAIAFSGKVVNNLGDYPESGED